MGCNFERTRLLGAAIPLPQGISLPVAELASPGLTELAIGLENKGALLVRPRGRPCEGRAGDQGAQRESGDKRLHGISPCLRMPVTVLHGSRPTAHALRLCKN